MEMPGDQQYFSVEGSEPMARPFWRTWKFGALLGGIAVAVAAIVLIVNIVLRDRETAMNDVQDRLAAAIAACAQERDPAACEERVRAGTARTEGNAALCEGITGDAFVSCVSLAAKQSADTQACAALQGEEKVGCENLAWNTLAETTVRVSACAEIRDQDLALACRTNVQAIAIAQGACAEAGIDEALCNEEQQYRIALAEGTSEACEELESEEYRYICLLALREGDADGDGLSAAEEERYGTSDTNPDSDNDGYSDGTEVENGFNPIE